MVMPMRYPVEFAWKLPSAGIWFITALYLGAGEFLKRNKVRDLGGAWGYE